MRAFAFTPPAVRVRPTRAHSPRMAPKTKSAAVIVDGVQCSVDLQSRVVTIGSGLVGHDERDRFKLPVAVPLEPYELLEARVSEKASTFTSSQSGPQGRTLRTLPATGPAASGRATGSGLSFLSEDPTQWDP